jgi:hypothetical protein
MANTINNLKDAPGLVAKMAAEMFANKLAFCKAIDKEDRGAWDGVNGYNSGDTIQISKPARFTTSTSADITSSIQDVDEEKVSLQLDTRRVVPIALDSAEIAHDLALKSWAKRVLDPAVSAIAQHVENAFLEKAVDATFQSVGTAGTPVFDTDMMLQAGQKIQEQACPDEDNMFALLSPKAMRLASTARNGFFNDSAELSKIYKKGYLGEADGFKFMRNNLLPFHTNGNDVAFEVRTTVSAEGQSTLVVEGLTTTTGTVTQGTVFTIASVNAVDPITKQDLGYLQQFTVTADATADGSGYATLSVSPAFYTAGSRQNITAFPADGDAITPVGSASTSYRQNLVFHKSAFRMASVPLLTPGGVDMAAQETVDGMTIRVVRDYSIMTDKLIMRLDFLGGFAAVRPEWACRVTE